MDRHYVLPITLAAALHAGLLFGFRTEHVRKLPVVKEILRLEDFHVPTEIDPPDPGEREPTAPKGAPIEAPPTQVDHSLPRPDVITINVPLLPALAVSDLSKLPLEPVGVP